MVASDSTPFRFGINENGEYGYIVTDSEGADSVVPFKSIPEGYSPAKILSGSFKKTLNGDSSGGYGETNVTVTFDPPFNVAPSSVILWQGGADRKYYKNTTYIAKPMVIRPESMDVRIYTKVTYNVSQTIYWEAIGFYE